MISDALDLKAAWDIPGEHYGTLPGVVGDLEACLTVPDEKVGEYVAVLGHPHSLKGGTMQNKVVTTLARMFKARGIPSLRFNFRGVLGSEGAYDAGIGESDDMLLLVSKLKAFFPKIKLIFAGFSFGSFVAYRAAAQVPNEVLITVAPPVSHVDFEAFSTAPKPWILVQGDEDEVIPPERVFDFASTRDITVLRFNETTHFFHGKLTELKTRLSDVLDAILV